MDEFNFLKNIERKEGKDKVKWPERVRLIFEQYDLKKYEREHKHEIEKEEKRKARKVRPHELISGSVSLGVLGKKYRETSADPV
jgi:hypothetical protein